MSQSKVKAAETGIASPVSDGFDLAPLSGGNSTELAQAIKEDLAGLGMPDLARVKMPSGSTPIFTIVRGKDDTAPETTQAIEAVIIHQHPAFAWWRDSGVSEGAQPDCSSMDGEYGTMSAELGGEVLKCVECPNNQFGSEIRPNGEHGRGKACKNGQRLYLLREGDLMPTVMTIPPSGLRAWKEYIQSLLMPRDRAMPMRRYWEVVTRIGLKPAKSSDNTSYCAPTFTMMRVLSPTSAQEIKAYGQAFANASASSDQVL